MDVGFFFMYHLCSMRPPRDKWDIHLCPPQPVASISESASSHGPHTPVHRKRRKGEDVEVLEVPRTPQIPAAYITAVGIW